MLIDVSLRQAGWDGKCGVIDFSIVTPAAESYCAQSAKIPLHAAKTREETNNFKYFQAYKALDDTHFDPFVVESGGELGVKAQEIFKKMQSYHPINGPKWIFYSILLEIKTPCYTCKDYVFQCTQMAHNNNPRNPDSIPIDFTDCYDDDTHETRRMIHSSGMECGSRRGGAELNLNWPMTR